MRNCPQNLIHWQLNVPFIIMEMRCIKWLSVYLCRAIVRMDTDVGKNYYTKSKFWSCLFMTCAHSYHFFTVLQEFQSFLTVYKQICKEQLRRYTIVLHRAFPVFLNIYPRGCSILITCPRECSVTHLTLDRLFFVRSVSSCNTNKTTFWVLNVYLAYIEL